MTPTPVEPPPSAAIPPRREQAGASLVVVGVLLAAGVLLGVVWSLVAPTVVFTAGEDGLRDLSFQSGRFFIAEGLYGVLAAGCGVVAALAVRRWLRGIGWPVVVALAGGGLFASVVAWRVGVWLGPAVPADEFAVGDLVELPLRLRASGLLLVWSIASLAVALWTAGLGEGKGHADDAPGAAPDPAELAAWSQSQDQERSTR